MNTKRTRWIALITTTHHNMVDVVVYENGHRNGASRFRNLASAIEGASKYTKNISISQEAKNHKEAESK